MGTAIGSVSLSQQLPSETFTCGLHRRGHVISPRKGVGRQSRWAYILRSGEHSSLTLELFFRKHGPPNALPTGWVKPIIRKSAFERTKLKHNPDYRYVEDFLFFTEMLLHCCRAIWFVTQCIYTIWPAVNVSRTTLEKLLY
jgi:hypothetical protein